MILTRKSISKNGKAAYYTGAAQTLRFPLGVFPNKTAPESITVTDDLFAPARQPKVKETKEERKARLAALPKPTLAEKIAKREAALAALKAKAEKEAAAANQPQL